MFKCAKCAKFCKAAKLCQVLTPQNPPLALDIGPASLVSYPSQMYIIVTFTFITTFTFHQQLLLPLTGAHYCHFHFHYHFHLPSTTSLTSHRSISLSVSNRAPPILQEHIIAIITQPHQQHLLPLRGAHY